MSRANTDAPRRLVIVESPAKAKTIAGFLGRGYVVESSLGHISDLPSKKTVWRKDQFEAVLAFGDQLNTHRITAWRDALFTASMPADHGMTLDSYPLKGGVR